MWETCSVRFTNLWFGLLRAVSPVGFLCSLMFCASLGMEITIRFLGALNLIRKLFFYPFVHPLQIPAGSSRIAAQLRVAQVLLLQQDTISCRTEEQAHNICLPSVTKSTTLRWRAFAQLDAMLLCGVCKSTSFNCKLQRRGVYGGAGTAHAIVRTVIAYCCLAIGSRDFSCDEVLCTNAHIRFYATLHSGLNIQIPSCTLRHADMSRTSCPLW